MNDAGARFAAGIDTHKDSHALCVLDGLGRKVFEGMFPANEQGYAAIAEAIGAPEDCMAVGIEGTVSYGAGLSRHLESLGYPVLEVLHPARRKRLPGSNKNDFADAERAARNAVSGDHAYTPKASNGWVEELRVLSVARKQSVKTATSAVNTAKSLIVTAPEQLRANLACMGKGELMPYLAKKRSCKDPLSATMLVSLRSLALVWQVARRQADEAEVAMRGILEKNAPALLLVEGCGPISAAELAIAAGDNPDRLASKDSFAALCGASPVEASSGRVVRHRLNRGGNRQANSALHQIAVTRMRTDERTKRYVAKRTAEGKSKKEIRRCLKRYIANEVYRAMMNPTDVPPKQGTRLKCMRLSLGLTQQEVASMLGVLQARISGIELGTRRVAKIEISYCALLERLTEERERAVATSPR